MKKRVFILLVTLLVLFQIHPVLAQTDGEKLKTLDLIQGGVDGDLMENQPLNRAQLAVILAQLTKTMDEAKIFTNDMGYTDILPTAWYNNYVNYALSKEWLRGVAPKQFDPNGTVTEEMVATVLLRVLGYNPPWGEAVYRAKGLGINVSVTNPSQILRKEVFSYMYKVLDTNLNSESTTLANRLDITLEDDFIFGLGKNFINLEGEEIDPEEYKLFANNGNDYYNYNGHYYYYLNDGSNPYPNGFNNILWGNDNYVFDVQTNDYIYNELTTLINDHYLIMLDNHANVVKESSFTPLEGYSIIDMNTKHIIYVSAKHGSYTYPKILTNYMGIPLIDTPNEDQYDYGMYFGLNRFILQYRYDKDSHWTDMPTLNLYDLENNDYVFDDYMEGYITIINDSEYLFSSGDNHVKKVNVDTGKETEIILLNEAIVTSLKWDVTLGYGIIKTSNNDSIIVDDTLTTVYDLPNHYSIANHNTNGSNTDVHFSKVGEKYFVIIDTEYGGEGLMDIEGNIIFDPLYSNYSLIELNNQQLLQVYTKSPYADLPFIDRSLYEYYDYNTLEKVDIGYGELKMILPNGNKIYRDPFTYYYVDTYNQLILSEYNLIYMPNYNLIITESEFSNYLFYDLDGVALDTLNSLTFDCSLQIVNNELIVINSNGAASIIDAEGNTLYGPYEGFYLFNKR